MRFSFKRCICCIGCVILPLIWFVLVPILFRDSYLTGYSDQFVRVEYVDEEYSEQEIDIKSHLLDLVDFRYKLEPLDICSDDNFGKFHVLSRNLCRNLGIHLKLFHFSYYTGHFLCGK